MHMRIEASLKIALIAATNVTQALVPESSSLWLSAHNLFNDKNTAEGEKQIPHSNLRPRKLGWMSVFA